MGDFDLGNHTRNYASYGLDSGTYDPLFDMAVGGGGISKEMLLKKLGLYNQFVDPAVIRAQQGMQGVIGKVGNKVGLGGTGLSNVARFAGGGAARNVLRALPAAGALYGISGIGNVLMGPESGANKLMDTAGMAAGAWGGVKGAAAGAAAGSVVPVLGTAAGAVLGGLAGAGLGKMGSDSLQWLFGDKKSTEQRKMEEALALLKAGVI